MKLLQKAVAYLVKFYRNYLSSYKLNTCKFYPSCSEYAQLALEKYGLIRGVLYSCGRILRCSWFTAGGVDLLP